MLTGLTSNGPDRQFGLMVVVAFLSRANANWAAPLYVSATVLVVAWAVERKRTWLLGLSVAIHLAACQPLVRMLLFFHVSDETQLAALQTGLYWADDRPKPDRESVATTAEAAQRGKLSCHA